MTAAEQNHEPKGKNQQTLPKQQQQQQLQQQHTTTTQQHLEAIRIILGAVRGTSHEELYTESGFCTLKERRKRHKLLMFHKMINYQCP